MASAPGQLPTTAPRTFLGIALAGGQSMVLFGSLVVGPCWEPWTYGAAVVQAFVALVVVVALALRDRLLLATMAVVASAGLSTLLFIVDDVLIGTSACRAG